MALFEELGERFTRGGREKKRLRRLDAYQRLREKYVEGDVDYSEGIPRGDLTFGDLLDIVEIYLEAQGLPVDYAVRLVGRAAGEHLDEVDSQSAQVEMSEMREELRTLGGCMSGNDYEEIDRSHPLYEMAVDLDRVGVSQLGRRGMCLYEGKGTLWIIPLEGDSLYRIHLPNTDHLDDGKGWIADVYREVGLPVVSRID